MLSLPDHVLGWKAALTSRAALRKDVHGSKSLALPGLPVTTATETAHLQPESDQAARQPLTLQNNVFVVLN